MPLKPGGGIAKPWDSDELLGLLGGAPPRLGAGAELLALGDLLRPPELDELDMLLILTEYAM
jgi:hypothetical protein